MYLKPLSWHDLQRCLSRAPVEVLTTLSQNPDKAFVAGGFVRSCVSGEEISDVDIFVPSREDAVVLADALMRLPKRKLHTSDNALTVTGGRLPVQFISRWTFSTPHNAVASFDFTISMAAFWASKSVYEPKGFKWDSGCHPDFYSDVAGKRLIYTSPIRIEEAGGSLLRVLKFYQRGYRIPLSSMGAVMARCVMGVDFDDLPKRNPASRKDPWTREEAIGVAIRRLLIEVDPEIDPNHLSHLPSQEEE